MCTTILMREVDWEACQWKAVPCSTLAGTLSNNHRSLGFNGRYIYTVMYALSEVDNKVPDGAEAAMAVEELVKTS